MDEKSLSLEELEKIVSGLMKRTPAQNFLNTPGVPTKNPWSQSPSFEQIQSLEAQEKLFNPIARLVAQRLKIDRRDIPLVSSNDFGELISKVIEDVNNLLDHSNLFAGTIEFESDGLKEKMKSATENLMRGLFKFVFTLVQKGLEGKDPYEDMWRSIRIVLNIAKEKSLAPEDIFKIPGIHDEISRGFYNGPDEYRERQMVLIQAFKPELIKDIIMPPTLDFISEIEEAVPEEDKEELETELMSQLEPACNSFRLLLRGRIEEDIDRIWPKK